MRKREEAEAVPGSLPRAIFSLLMHSSRRGRGVATLTGEIGYGDKQEIERDQAAGENKQDSGSERRAPVRGLFAFGPLRGDLAIEQAQEGFRRFNGGFDLRRHGAEGGGDVWRI